MNKQLQCNLCGAQTSHFERDIQFASGLIEKEEGDICPFCKHNVRGSSKTIFHPKRDINKFYEGS